MVDAGSLVRVSRRRTTYLPRATSPLPLPPLAFSCLTYLPCFVSRSIATYVRVSFYYYTCIPACVCTSHPSSSSSSPFLVTTPIQPSLFLLSLALFLHASPCSLSSLDLVCYYTSSPSQLGLRSSISVLNSKNRERGPTDGSMSRRRGSASCKNCPPSKLRIGIYPLAGPRPAAVYRKTCPRKVRGRPDWSCFRKKKASSA